MWKRQALLARVLKLSLPKTSKTYQVFGAELLKSKSIFPLKWTTTLISHNFSTQSDSAKALFELEKDNEAFSSIKKELSLNPQDQELHGILIDKLGEENRLQTDLESFYKTIVDKIADPKSVSNFYSTSAEALFDKKMFAQSILAFRKALKNGPPMGLKLRYKFGQALLHEGLYAEALFQFEEFKKKPRSNEDFHFFMRYADTASSGAAYANYCLGRAGMADEEFEKIITYKSGTIPTKMSDLLTLCHLEDDLLLPFLRKRMGKEEEELKLPYW